MIKLLLVIAALILISVFLQYERKAIVITDYVIEDSKVPEDFDGVKILQVSDLQSEYFGKNHAELLDKAGAVKPDYIFITGDIADRNHTNIKASLMAAEGLAEIAPTYYVNGNHEMRLSEENKSVLYDGLKNLGVTVLFDVGTLITRRNTSISICGLSEFVIYGAKEDDHEIYKNTDVSTIKAMADQLAKSQWIADAGLDNDKIFKVLLTHEPQYFDVYDSPGFDLIFTGHAHGGQFRLPFIGGLFAPGQGILPKYTEGVHKGRWSKMVISRGLGNSTFPIRLFNRPELVTVTLSRK